MRKTSLIATAYLVCFATMSAGAHAAPACKGKDKNNPDCQVAEEPPPEESVTPGLVDSASVDWFNQKVTVRGSGLGSVEFTIGGSSPLSQENGSDTQVDLPFDATLAAEVTLEGTYLLKADGADVISIYFISEVIDPLAADCPCQSDWSNQFSGMAWWPTPGTECVGYEGAGVNDASDLAAIVLPNPEDPSVYPHYPVGASFVPGDPVNSYCSLVQLNADATFSELSHHRINEGQQATCAAWLQTNVCATTVPE